MKKVSVLFLGPIQGIKPYVVMKLNENSIIDWQRSVVLTDQCQEGSRFIEYIEGSAVPHESVSDVRLEGVASNYSSAPPDFLISCGWGWKIPKELISLPKIAALNCHSSFLPDYKGGSVYRHYWANCEEEAGATIHLLTDEFDAGNIVTQQKFRVFRNDDPATLLWRTSEITAALLREAICLCRNGYVGVPQSGGRYFFKLSKRKLYVYRMYNVFAKHLGLPRRLTPHKVL